MTVSRPLTLKFKNSQKADLLAPTEKQRKDVPMSTYICTFSHNVPLEYFSNITFSIRNAPRMIS